MEKIIKIILAILLFFCLLKMPYGYYELVRFLALIVFSLLAYFAYKENKQVEMIIFLSLTILFQPLFKIALGRILWNVIDVIVGFGLLISLFIKPKSNE